MNRRSFLQRTGAFFAVLVTGGPKQLEASKRWVVKWEDGRNLGQFESAAERAAMAMRAFSRSGWRLKRALASAPERNTILIAGHPVEACDVIVYDIDEGDHWVAQIEQTS